MLNLKSVIFFCLACQLYANDAEDAKHQALFSMQNVALSQAIEQYQLYRARTHEHDFEMIRRIGLLAFQQGISSANALDFTATLYGAGLSGAFEALEILEKGLNHSDPQMQMLALHFIAKMGDDRCNLLLKEAMNSPFLSTRLEAAYYMAEKKDPMALGHIESLMLRLPPPFHPLFPSLFAILGTKDATDELCHLLCDNDVQVRVEAVLNIARLKRDDLLPRLRKHLTHSNIAELEAVVYAIGCLKDSDSISRVQKLSYSQNDNVKIAAILSLLELGDRSRISELITLARSGNLFAIAALGHLSEGVETLAELTLSPDLSIRLNAAVALFSKHDPRSIKVISEILIQDTRDLAYFLMPSLGKTMAIWKAIPSAEIRSKDPSIDLSLSFVMREEILKNSVYLPSEHFFQLAQSIVNQHQDDLIPSLIHLIENLRTPEAIAFLEKGCQRHDYPFLRDYSHLALFRLKEKGPYREYMMNWINQKKDCDLIRLRPMLPWKMRLDSRYTLTPEETSQLLIEAFVALAEERDMDFLIKAIFQSNIHNRYALFGLLLRAME